MLTYLVENGELASGVREERSLEEIRTISKLLDRLEAMK